MDSAFSQMLIAPWAMFLTAGYEKQTCDGYEKSVNVGGNPGFEKWNSRDKRRRAQPRRRQAVPGHDRRQQHRRHQGARRSSRRRSMPAKLACAQMKPRASWHVMLELR